MDKFHRKLPKEDLKKFARDVNKKLVASDYKNNRVDDPTSISSKQAKKVKAYVQDFFERALVKYTEQQRKMAQSTARAGEGASQHSEAASPTAAPGKDSVGMSDVEGDGEEDSSPNSPSRRKRKRDGEAESPEETQTPSETPSVKRVKEDGQPADIPSPPTPPPPPMDTPPTTEEERTRREQEEALMRENEEAQRLEDEAQAHGDGKHQPQNGRVVMVNGSVGVNGAVDQMDVDKPLDQGKAKQAVLSH